MASRPRTVEARNARSGAPAPASQRSGLLFALKEMARQMTTDYRARIAEIDEYAIELRKLIPDTVSAFAGLSKAAQAPGSLDKKTKELLALTPFPWRSAVMAAWLLGFHAERRARALRALKWLRRWHRRSDGRWPQHELCSRRAARIRPVQRQSLIEIGADLRQAIDVGFKLTDLV